MTNKASTTSQHSSKRYSYSGSDFTIWAMYNNSIEETRNLQFLIGKVSALTDAEEIKSTEEEIARVVSSGSAVINLGTLQAITTSYASSLSAVEVIGSSMPIGYTRGQKTYAGSLVFTVMDKEPMRDLLAHGLDKGSEGFDTSSPFISFDQIPPFNIIIEGNSELPDVRGVPQSIRKIIIGVRFMSGGETISIDDFFLEQQHQYVANYITPWVKVMNTSHYSNEPASDLDKKIQAFLVAFREMPK